MPGLLILLLSFILSLTPARAVEPDEILIDPALESRARSLSLGLRCLVCQNQSIDDSDAPLARDLRVLIRERLQAGDTDRQVKNYVVSRYGDFVLLKPPFKPETVLLWASPFLLLLAGVIYIIFHRRPDIPPPRPLSRDEEESLRDLTRDVRSDGP